MNHYELMTGEIENEGKRDFVSSFLITILLVFLYAIGTFFVLVIFVGLFVFSLAYLVFDKLFPMQASAGDPHEHFR